MRARQKIEIRTRDDDTPKKRKPPFPALSKDLLGQQNDGCNTHTHTGTGKGTHKQVLVGSELYVYNRTNIESWF